MRSLIKIISVLSIASAIASKAIEDSADDQDAAALYKSMDDSAMAALAMFPGALSARELNFISDRISLFCDKTNWDHQQLHIHNYLIFSSEQLETVRYELVVHNADKRKIEAIEKLIDIEADIYDKYADKGECPEFNIEGLRANDVWDKIWN
jgi:hypothetical protein